jgi:uncharacterized membrane protein
MNAKKLTTGVLLGLGAGVATAYLTDPEVGKKRRAALAGEARKLFDNATHETRKSLTDSGHRLKGVFARLRTNLKNEPPSDAVLEARVRSRMGRVVSHPKKVHVLCDRGVVTLWGLVPEEEISALIVETEKIPGVIEVVDHLEAARFDEIPAEMTASLKHARDETRLNWNPSKRMVVGAGGAALAAYGSRQGGALGKALTLLGAGMVVRSAMQNHLRAKLALGESSPGFELEKTIRINAPISDLFDFWANPQNYPKAFAHVAKIERLGENLFRWTFNGPGGIPVGWKGMITRAVPNTLVEWKSLPGSAIGNFGVVRFDPHYDASTRIHIRMFYRPPAGILGKFFAELFGADPSKILDEDLKRLKYIFENGGYKAWEEEYDETELLKTAAT